MNRHGRDFKLLAEGALIEGLDIRQLVDILQIPGVHFAFRQGVEHECVVGIRAVGDVDDFRHGLFTVVAEIAGRAEGGAYLSAVSAPSASDLNSSSTGLCSRYSTRFAVVSA